MPAKKTVCFFIALLLLSGLMCTVEASSDKAVTFSGAGVTIDLIYPEEAHPENSTTHKVTITANTDLDQVSVALFIYAPVGSTLQHIKNQTLSWSALPENTSLPTGEINFTPQQANGTLYCNMTVQTVIGGVAHYAYYSFYTTRVSELTFSEMQSLYDEMLANYTALQVKHTTLQNEYDSLLANYTSLFENYTALASEHNSLSGQYTAEVAKYQKLSDDYTKLQNDKNDLEKEYGLEISELGDLQVKYGELNETFYNLQGNCTDLQGNITSLQIDYDDLNQAYTALLGDLTRSESDLNSDKIVMVIFIVAVAGLVAFIVYTKWKKQEPYVVIRKETVSVNQDENSEAS
jgi:predicted nuclease with TOPRIM domain